MRRVLIDNWQVTIAALAVAYVWLCFAIVILMPADRFRGDLKHGEWDGPDEGI